MVWVKDHCFSMYLCCLRTCAIGDLVGITHTTPKLYTTDWRFVQLIFTLYLVPQEFLVVPFFSLYMFPLAILRNKTSFHVLFADIILLHSSVKLCQSSFSAVARDFVGNWCRILGVIVSIATNSQNRDIFLFAALEDWFFFMATTAWSFKASNHKYIYECINLKCKIMKSVFSLLLIALKSVEVASCSPDLPYELWKCLNLSFQLRHCKLLQHSGYVLV